MRLSNFISTRQTLPFLLQTFARAFLGLTTVLVPGSSAAHWPVSFLPILKFLFTLNLALSGFLIVFEITAAVEIITSQVYDSQNS